MSCGGKVLFLCSGNYYRSRFAEVLFNAQAEAAGLAWRADSRAVTLGESLKYIRGPISPFAVEGLTARGIVLEADVRHPMQVVEADIAGSDRVIAMKEAEHRDPLEKLFPALTDRIEYWHMHDIDCAEPAAGLAGIEGAIGELIEELKARS
ncbi:MAG: low molecular weight phosphatase family protein [Planctomycetes bacterium]|nr:low molecular weight phosphatase family protein [Planctomycetota bacterium]